ncbi:MAG: hypothetical protein DRN49_06275 [Thaumarchaeota archaeon]|nr:MAG: hypothetical protein DRN49_06275 [Nitrososphaerota archaeon]
MGEYDKLTTIRLPSWIFEELKKRGLNVSALTRSLLESYLRRGGADGYSVLAAELKEVKGRIEENILKAEENMRRIRELEAQTATSLSTLRETLQKIGSKTFLMKQMRTGLSRIGE